MVERTTFNQGETPEGAAAEEAANAAAIKAADDANVNINGEQQGESTAKPDWCPEKFWNAETGEVNQEGLAKSYAHLEGKLGGKEGDADQQEEKPNETAEEQEGDKTADEQTAEDNAVAKARAEFDTKGELTDDTYESLSKVGLDRETVDAYISGVHAQAQVLEQKAFSAAGGSKENYQQMVKWASANLSQEEIDGFDKAVENPAMMETAVKGLFARYQAEADVDPATVVGGNSNQATGSVFRSTAELTTAMGDKRYTTDSAYRADVAERIDRSIKAGINLFG